jgi:hypothetical protein
MQQAELPEMAARPGLNKRFLEIGEKPLVRILAKSENVFSQNEWVYSISKRNETTLNFYLCDICPPPANRAKTPPNCARRLVTGCSLLDVPYRVKMLQE